MTNPIPNLDKVRPEYRDMIIAAQAKADHLGIALSSLGLRLTNNGKFFSKILKGEGCAHHTHEKVMRELDINPT